MNEGMKERKESVNERSVCVRGLFGFLCHSIRLDYILSIYYNSNINSFIH